MNKKAIKEQTNFVYSVYEMKEYDVVPY